ncbi:MAG: arsenate reductase ArsC [Thermodesulfobacteriota bacterium]
MGGGLRERMDTRSTSQVTRVLFVCAHNSGRSQMAEAYLNLLGQGRFFAESAGLEPRDIDPFVVKVMGEEGIDLIAKKAKRIFDFFKEGRLYDYVIYVCDRETEAKCPVFPGVRRTLNWAVPDPAAVEGTSEERLRKTREIRDQLKDRVFNLILENQTQKTPLLR